MDDHMDLTPDLLRTFTAAGQTLNFTRAAQMLNLTQSAVSVHIRKLEQGLGKPLFHRIPRGVELTPDGLTLLAYAEKILTLQNQAVTHLAAPVVQGRIRIGAAEDYAALHLPRILQQFARKFPRVQVDLFCDLSNDLQDMLHDGKLDLCLRNTPDLPPGATYLRDEPLVWIAGETAWPEENSPLPLALYHTGCIYRQWALDALTKRQIPHRVAYTSPSISGILAAVQSGLAVAPVGASTPMDGCRVVQELPALPRAVVSLQGKAQISPAVEAFSVHICDEFQGISRNASSPEISPNPGAPAPLSPA